MKNLKIKLGLFSLLMMFAVSVFLTSCEQEVPIMSELSDNELEILSDETQIDINTDNLPSKQITLSDESGTNKN